jgi:hypothetical protein
MGISFVSVFHIFKTESFNLFIKIISIFLCNIIVDLIDIIVIYIVNHLLTKP